MSFPVLSSSARLRLALTLAAAVTVMAVCATHAGAATFNQTFSNPTRDAVTKQTVSVSAVGDDHNLTKLTITEQAGLGFNYPALGDVSDRCPSSSMPSVNSTFDPSGCPSQAKVGSITVTLPSGTATGNIYLIHKTQFPWLGVDVSPTTASGNPSDITLRFAFRTSWPQVDPSCDVLTSESGWCEQQLALTSTSFGESTIVSATITFGGAARGSLPGDLFYLLPSDPCNLGATTKGVMKDSNNSLTTVLDNDALYCPFQPTYGGSLSSTVAGSLVAVTMNWSNPTGSSNVKSITMDADPRLGPNIPAFGTPDDQCPSSSMPTALSPFDASACPAQAKIGSYSIETPGYSGTATGDVYVINKSPSPMLAVNLSPTTAVGNPAGLSIQFALIPQIVQIDPACDPLTADAGFCPLRVRLLSMAMPDIPTTSAQLTFGGPDRAGVLGTLPGLLFALPSDCETPLETTVKITPYVGVPKSFTDHTTLTGC